MSPALINPTQVLILLSDGVSNTGGSPVDEAKQLRQDGVAIYTIGVGLFDRSQLQLIASTQYHFFIFYNFEDFKRLALRIRGGNCTARKPVSIMKPFLQTRKNSPGASPKIVP